MAPITISLKRMRGPQEFVMGRKEEELECLASGSRPAPEISWWRDGRQLITSSIKVRLFFYLKHKIQKKAQ